MRKQLTIIIILLVGGLIGASYYLGQQVTQVPEWYQAKSFIKNKKVKVTNTVNSAALLKRKMMQFERGEEVQLNLSSSEINDLIKLILLRELGTQEPEGLPEGIQARIENNELEIGGIVNLANLAQTDMQPRYKELLEKIVSRVPQFANRDLYLGIRGNPVLSDSRIELSKDSVIKIGNLSFKREDLSKVAGLSEAKVNNMLGLRLRSISVKDISIQQDKLNLAISRK